MKKLIPPNISKYFSIASYYDWFLRKFVDPRYHREGDIHVFEDDHIEWSRIIKTLCDAGGEVMSFRSYLLFRRGYDLGVYNKHKGKTTDMSVLIIKKREWR
jgi:hypothetical protein